MNSRLLHARVTQTYSYKYSTVCAWACYGTVPRPLSKRVRSE